MKMSKNCHDCGVKPGEMHKKGCDVERCNLCGYQAISCDCTRTQTKVRKYGGPILWDGEWPGVLDCQNLNFYCKRNPEGPGFVSCEKDDPEAMEDLNRLYEVTRWDKKLRQRVVTH